MSTYTIHRSGDQVEILSPENQPLYPSQQYSLTGFGAGYVGQGPMESAYAILKDFYEKNLNIIPINIPHNMCQKFMYDYVSRTNQGDDNHPCYISVEEITSWLAYNSWKQYSFIHITPKTPAEESQLPIVIKMYDKSAGLIITIEENKDIPMGILSYINHVLCHDYYQEGIYPIDVKTHQLFFDYYYSKLSSEDNNRKEQAVEYFLIS
ncbi:MAG: hypothetical protein NZM04_02495 [Methylacidiphilales bacterium]|nr:hypothetical protein [Candidatus Methylacidiphilales bacterium]